MPERALILAGRLRYIRTAEKSLLAVGEGESIPLSGLSARWVEWMLAGADWAAAFERARTEFGEEAAQTAAGRLVASRIVVTHTEAASSESAAFSEILGRPVRSAPIALAAVGLESAEPIHQLLVANGHKITDSGARLLVVATSDYLHPDLESLNERRAPWLIVKPVGRRIWLGPVFVHGSGVCRPCLVHWIKLHRWRQAAEGSYGEPSPGYLPSTLAIAGGLLATAVSELISGHDPSKLNTSILTFDTMSFEMERHAIRSLPECPRCKPQGTQPVHALGSHITGILEHVEVKPVSEGTYAALAHACLPLPLNECRLPQSPFSVGGRGKSAEEAKERCLFEGIERYSATFRGDERPVSGDPLPRIELTELLHFSPLQYQQRDRWNARPGDAFGVPELCRADEVRQWCPVESLIDGSTACAPAGFVYLWYPFPGEPRYDYSNTNGCAAGASREQAIENALLELIERDALAIWWYNRLQRPAIEWRDWDDPELNAIGAALKHDGRELALLDLTNDVGVPATVAYAANEGGKRIYFGSAARICPLEAARSAANELLHFWFWGERGRNSQDKSRWIDASSVAEHAWFVPSGKIEARKPGRGPFSEIIASLRRCGLHPYFADLTRPEIGMPVVRAIVPGLRHHGPRLAKGRLYDVPVQMGWIRETRTEAGMNPDACVL